MNADVVTGKPISEGQLPERFDSSDYQVLLVANKYQTGERKPASDKGNRKGEVNR